MPPPVVVPAPHLCHALDQLIAWATDVSNVICCMDPSTELVCGSGGTTLALDATRSGGSQPLLAVNCPPPLGSTSTTGTTTAGDLCKTMERILAWAQDLKDIACSIPADLEIHVPGEVVTRARERQTALRGTSVPQVLHTLRCPPPGMVPREPKQAG
jgi:hypothetical protein